MPVSDLICLCSTACYDLLDKRSVVLILGPSLPHRVEKIVETGVHELLAGNAADRRTTAHRGNVVGFSRIEGLMILVKRTDIRVAGCLHRYAVGVGDGVPDLVPDFIGSVGKVDGIAQGFSHLAVAVKTAQTGNG